MVIFITLELSIKMFLHKKDANKALVPGPTEVYAGYELEIPNFLDPSYTVRQRSSSSTSTCKYTIMNASKMFGESLLREVPLYKLEV